MVLIFAGLLEKKKRLYLRPDVRIRSKTIAMRESKKITA
jgi:hypothetical protein